MPTTANVPRRTLDWGDHGVANEVNGMTCFHCGHTMTTRRENVRYDASGLPGVTLVGVDVSRCAHCGEHEAAIPHIADLHHAMAHALIRKTTRLTPAEVRFLRRSLDRSGQEFADHMGTTAETVSRWENGRTPIGAQADRLLRLMVLQGQPSDSYDLAEMKRIARQEAIELRTRLVPNEPAGPPKRPDGRPPSRPSRVRQFSQWAHQPARRQLANLRRQLERSLVHPRQVVRPARPYVPGEMASASAPLWNSCRNWTRLLQTSFAPVLTVLSMLESRWLFSIFMSCSVMLSSSCGRGTSVNGADLGATPSDGSSCRPT